MSDLCTPDGLAELPRQGNSTRWVGLPEQPRDLPGLRAWAEARLSTATTHKAEASVPADGRKVVALVEATFDAWAEVVRILTDARDLGAAKYALELKATGAESRHRLARRSIAVRIAEAEQHVYLEAVETVEGVWS